jgi:hypothetical protein
VDLVHPRALAFVQSTDARHEHGAQHLAGRRTHHQRPAGDRARLPGRGQTGCAGSAANARSLAFGNLGAGYVSAKPGGDTMVLRLEETYGEKLQVGFLAFAWLDGARRPETRSGSWSTRQPDVPGGRRGFRIRRGACHGQAGYRHASRR